MYGRVHFVFSEVFVQWDIGTPESSGVPIFFWRYRSKLDHLVLGRKEEMRIKINSGVLDVEGIIPDLGQPGTLPPAESPAEKKPYFDIGEATGKPGETVDIVVEAGCPEPMSGFHIGGGVGLLPADERSGYGKFKAVGVILGPFMRNYLKDEGIIHDSPGHQHDHFWSIFQFIPWDPNRALPEEWWEYGMSTFSIDLKEPPLPSIPIPGGTKLFTLKIEILSGTPSGEYVLTCRDEWYYTHTYQRRRDFMFTNERQGITKVETFGGKLTVT